MGIAHVREGGAVMHRGARTLGARAAFGARVALAGLAAPLRLAAFVSLLPSMLAPPAEAHDQSFSYAQIDWARDRIAARVTLHRDDAASLLGTVRAETLMDLAVLSANADRLAAIVSARFRLEGDDRELTLRLASVEAKPHDRAITLSFVTEPFRGPVVHLAISCGLSADLRDHETFLTVAEGGRVGSQGVLAASRPRAEFYSNGPAGALAAAATYLRAGIHHIFIGPDHILFIVGLLLLGGGLMRIIKVATAFTLAHSITLAAATVGWISPPGWLIEPLIALSIVYVGVENLRRRGAGGDWRTRIAFCFGLVHGFGFASVLREVGLPREALGWSLLAFNVGVEAGQAAIVLTVAPVLSTLSAYRPRFASRAVAACSWTIVAAGAFWFVERVIEPVRLLGARLL